MKILAFGKIAELLGTAELELDNMPNTEILIGFLYQQYPELKKMKFTLAVNKKQVAGNTEIPQGAEVALLPPFSGG